MQFQDRAIKSAAQRRTDRWHALLCLLLVGAATHAAAAADDSMPGLAPVRVYGNLPLPGLGLPLDEVPADVQAFSSQRIERRRPAQLGEFLGAEVGSVSINDTQSSPLQPDLNLRGLNSSAVLGAPQGVSVFLDGVRLNEAFADTVNWDLIPVMALSELEVVPGSNPVFGLNALGGAVLGRTRDGFSDAGSLVQAGAGAYGRASLDFRQGGNDGARHIFVAGRVFHDDGWRQHGASDARALYAKSGWRGADDRIDASLTLARSVLHPALPTPVEFLDTPREAYNWPEQNSNRLAFLTLQGRHALGAQQLIAGNLYLRRLSSENLTSDTNSDPELANQGVNTLGTAEQLGWGGGAQYSGEFGSTGNRHELALGLGVDMGSIDYQQLIQPANFDSQRGSTVLLGPYSLIAPGATSGANLRTGSQRFGVYAADTWSPGESWHFSASARYDHAELRLEDLSGTRPALNGINDFARVNPALGLTYAAAPELTLYAAANQGMRTPSPVELSCADPNQPCAIPANFLADPPLKAVIARTLELGARGRLPGNGDALAWVWHGAVFRTRIQDDIRFVNAPTSITQTGFFQNIGSTLREGLEAGLSWQGQQWAASAEYSYIRAVFDSAYSELSVNNSARDANGNIQIPAGASIPQVPRHNLKLHADWSPVSGSRLGAVMQAYSQQYARGDENNADVHGTLGGFALWALQGETRLAPGWSATMDVENLFDRHFQSYGQLGSNLFTGPGRSFDATNANPTLFVSPGTARRITLGLRWQT